MSRYIRLLFAKLKYHAGYYREYRFGAFVHFLSSMLWFVLGIAGISLVVGNVQSVGGWEREQMYILILVFYLAISIAHTFYYNGLFQLGYQIIRGDLDLYLIKPVPERFWLSITHISLAQMLRSIVILVVLFGYMYSIDVTVRAEHVVLFGMQFLLGQGIILGIQWCIVSALFWFDGVRNFSWLLDRVIDVGRVPLDQLPQWLKILFIFVVPVSFVTYFPTVALLGGFALWHLLLSVGIVMALFIISGVIWRNGIRLYASASS